MSPFQCGDVRPQLERPVHQRKRREPGQRDVSEILDGLLEPLIGDGASEPPTPENGGCLDVDEVRCGQFLMGVQQLAACRPASPSSMALASTEAATTITRATVQWQGLRPPE